MSIPELPPLNHRSRSLSGSSDLPHRKQGEPSLLDLASRSPLSFSSSSGNSHLSTTGTNSRLPRSSSHSLFDQSSTTTATAKRLGTLFEQKSSNSRSVTTGGQNAELSRTKSVSEARNVGMVRGNSSSAVANLKNNNPGFSSTTRSQNPKTMKRIMSEPKLINDRKNFKNSHVHSNARTKTESPNSKSRQKCVDRNGNSRFGKGTNSTRRHMSASTEFSDNVKFEIDNGDKGDEEEEERNERVLMWLEEVGHDAEVPPEPDIEYDDTPPQTDSAIHIVYGQS